MNPTASITTDTHAPTPQDRLVAAAGELRANQEELAEMRRRRDAWKERANRLAADVDALKLAVVEATEDRTRVSRLAQAHADDLARARTEVASLTAALEAANARVVELSGQRATAVSVAESAELGWKNAQVDLEDETKKTSRAEASIAELALAVGQPTLRGQELLDHVRETEQLVHELRQVCAEQKHELRRDDEVEDRLRAELETARAERAGLLQVIDQILRARRARERESQMVATREVVVCRSNGAHDGGDVIPWDDSPAPELCPGCWDEQAEIAAAQVLARLEVSHA